MPKHKPLSDFMCRELLYDYATGNMSAIRAAAVEECLNQNEDIVDELRALKEGLKYTAELSRAQVSSAYLDEIVKPKGRYEFYTEHWAKLPRSIKVGTEALAVLVLLITVLVLIPKQYLPWKPSGESTLFEFDRNKKAVSDVEEITTEAKVAAADTAGQPAPQESETVGVTTVTYGPPRPPGLIAKTESLPVPDVKKPAQDQVAQNTKTTSTQQVATIQNSTPTTQVAKGKGKGEIYRLYMSSKDIEKITPGAVAKILELGGQKAGEVQLGWRRKGGSYFHFTLPESNLETLKNFLQNFGPVRIVKEPHVRIMPEGTVRLILWIEQTGGSNIEDDNTGATSE